MSLFRVFPQRGEMWGECFICGETFPESELRRHYKTRRFVDKDCQDRLNHTDFLELRSANFPLEHKKASEQPVANQGQAVDIIVEEE